MYWNDESRYEGNWEKNKMVGKGIYCYKSGDVYEGNWENNKKEGKGIFYFINEDRYEGDWKNG